MAVGSQSLWEKICVAKTVSFWITVVQF